MSQFFGAPRSHEAPASFSSIGTKIDDVIRCFDDIQVVLDDHDRVAQGNQVIQNLEKLLDILKMKTRGGLVQQIEGLSRVPLAQFPGEFQALGLSSREGRGGLPQSYVSQAHIQKGLELSVDVWNIFEKSVGLTDGQIQDIGDVPPLVFDLQGVPIETKAPAGFAGDVDIGKKVHFDFDDAIPVAGFTPSAPDIETEPSGLVSPHLGVWEHGEEFTNVGENPGIGRRIGTGRTSDRALIDADDLIDIAQALDGPDTSHFYLGPVEFPGQVRVEDFVDETALAGTRDARHTGQGPEGDLNVDVFEVVLPGTLDPNLSSIAGASFFGHGNLPSA